MPVWPASMDLALHLQRRARLMEQEVESKAAEFESRIAAAEAVAEKQTEARLHETWVAETAHAELLAKDAKLDEMDRELFHTTRELRRKDEELHQAEAQVRRFQEEAYEAEEEIIVKQKALAAEAQEREEAVSREQAEARQAEAAELEQRAFELAQKKIQDQLNEVRNTHKQNFWSGKATLFKTTPTPAQKIELIVVKTVAVCAKTPQQSQGMHRVCQDKLPVASQTTPVFCSRQIRDVKTNYHSHYMQRCVKINLPAMTCQPPPLHSVSRQSSCTADDDLPLSRGGQLAQP